ncbi:Alcohol sulfotransferase A [Eumeta japonica]|uniref:Alcohol sulfotransferase A n=1 Tax=Eumeta variegata TaxID=151549 RepID=A0A4C1UG94_EUMVA|nr:Alcohol sulfotransferase A [Eumeta japonica]
MGTLRRLTEFLGKEYKEQELEELFEYLQFDNMKKKAILLAEVAVHPGLTNNEEEAFFRKGRSGNWKNYFDEEMTAQAEAWIKENLKNTDLSFPKS